MLLFNVIVIYKGNKKNQKLFLTLTYIYTYMVRVRVMVTYTHFYVPGYMRDTESFMPE